MNFITGHIDGVYIAGGLAALFVGGESLVRGAVGLAERLKIPKLVIGLTIVGFGTSMPELLVSLQSIGAGTPDISVGNIVGSNIANILLILAIGALLHPAAVKSAGERRDVVVMVLASAAFLWVAWQGEVTRTEGMLMVAALAAYLMLVFFFQRKAPDASETKKPMGVGWAIICVAAGLALLIYGADFLIKGATAVAHDFGVSEAVIGLTLVAVGTSLPELTVSVISSLRRQNEVAVGNVLGSNIFNILGILGIAAWIHPLVISPAFLRVDLPLMAASALMVCLLVWRGKPIGRLAGLSGLLIYAVYCTWLTAPGLFGASAISTGP